MINGQFEEEGNHHYNSVHGFVNVLPLPQGSSLVASKQDSAPADNHSTYSLATMPGFIFISEPNACYSKKLRVTDRSEYRPVDNACVV